MPFEYESPAGLQAPTCDTQPDKPSAGLESVSTQTGDEYITQSSSIQKHQSEYGPHKRFSRKEEEEMHTEELGHIKGIKVICSLGLLLQQFAGPCKYSGCIHWTTLEYLLFNTPVPLFSLCTKSLIAVLKVQINCLRKTGAVLFVSREIIRGNIIKRAK